jgi:hypothetical protein
MQNDLTESVQSSVRPGEMVDTYYAGETNSSKQAYPCVVTTKFVQNFQQLGAGSSSFTISPAGGVSDVIITLTTPASTGSNYTNGALSSGWGYAAINRYSIRYGSSAQYFFSGPQNWIENVLDAENQSKVDQMVQLGGQTAVAAACGGQVANVYLKLPHSSCRAQGKPLPFPSDLLVQPIVITVELYGLNQVITNQTSGGSGLLGNAPTAFATAQLQVKQELLTDSSDLLARRVDMNTSAYTLPLVYFPQQEATQTVVSDAQGSLITANLVGFRAGECKSILLWLTPQGTSNPNNGNYQPLIWSPMNNIQLTYNGEVFQRFDSNSFQLWNIVEDEKGPVVNGLVQQTAFTGAASTTQVSYYARLDFSQVNMGYDREYKLVHGKPVLNSVVQVQFTAAANTTYTLHAVYLYNSSLLLARGSAEYIF